MSSAVGQRSKRVRITEPSASGASAAKPSAAKRRSGSARKAPSAIAAPAMASRPQSTISRSKFRR